MTKDRVPIYTKERYKSDLESHTKGKKEREEKRKKQE
jgi:hypothetical protein